MVVQRVILAMVGDAGVGKSSILVRLCHGIFAVDYDPTLEDEFERRIQIDELDVSVSVMDLAPLSYRDEYGLPPVWHSVDGIVLVYDIVSRDSFTNISTLRQRCLRDCGNTDKPMALVGNKCDLDFDRNVSHSEGQNRAIEWDIPFIETSALKTINIHQAIEDIARFVLSRKSPRPKKSTSCTLM